MIKSVFTEATQKKSLDRLISNLCQNQEFQPRDFWEFREFYSQGHFVPNLEVTHGTALLELEKITPPKTILLTFVSPQVSSQESLVSVGGLSEYLAVNHVPVEKELCHTPSLVMYEIAPARLKLIFVTSLEKMRETNGFFDYLPNELELMKNQMWLNETEIITPSTWEPR